MFRSSPSATGLLGLVCGISCIIVSPVAGWLSDRYSVRLMAMVGGVMATAGILFTGFAPNLPVAIFTYGVVYGVSMSIVDGPLLGMLSKYFKRHLNLANGIAFTGSSIGNLTLGHVMAAAIETYTSRGAMIILASFWLQSCVVGALMRPFVSNEAEVRHQCSPTDPRRPCLSDNPDKPLNDDRQNSERNDTGKHKDSEDDESKVTGPITKKEENDSFHDENTETDMASRAEEASKVRPTMNNVVKEEECSSRDGVSSMNSRNPCLGLGRRIISSEYFRFLSNKRLILTLLFLGTGYYASYSMLVAFPAYMLETRLTRYDVGWYLFVLGLIELPARIIVAAVVDRWCSSAEIPLAVSYGIMGAVGFLSTFVQHYYVFLCYACVHGCFGGLAAVFTGSLMRGCVEVEQMGSAMGLAVMQMHGTSAVASAIIGVLRQLTGSYTDAIRFGAAIYTIGFLAFLIVHCCCRKTGTDRPKETVLDEEIAQS